MKISIPLLILTTCSGLVDIWVVLDILGSGRPDDELKADFDVMIVLMVKAVLTILLACGTFLWDRYDGAMKALEIEEVEGEAVAVSVSSSDESYETTCNFTDDDSTGEMV